MEIKSRVWRVQAHSAVRTSAEQDHIALAARLGELGRDAIRRREAAARGAKLGRDHEPAPAHVRDREALRQLQQALSGGMVDASLTLPLLNSPIHLPTARIPKHEVASNM